MPEEIGDDTTVVDWPCTMVASQLSVRMPNMCIILVKYLLSRFTFFYFLNKFWRDIYMESLFDEISPVNEAENSFAMC